ncbi:hypothetical protein SB767_32395, partial [Bacillus sp. SIMBA_069]
LLQIFAVARVPRDLGERDLDLRMPAHPLDAVGAEGLADVIGRAPGDDCSPPSTARRSRVWSPCRAAW